MKKKLIIVIAAGLISFGGTFVAAWLTSKTPATTTAAQPRQAQPKPEQTQSTALATIAAAIPEEEARRAMTEKQLKSLVYEVREKIQEYENKLKDLNQREERLQLAHNELKKDIEQLNDLRIELASTVAALKAERDKLEKSRIEIARTERSNLMSIAATYDKMDPVSAGKILTSMSKTQGTSPTDAVKILRYMTERTRANVLAELATNEPAFAAYLCEKLKRTVEQK